MQIQVTVPEWLKLPQETRTKLVEIFKLHKSHGTQMEQQGEGSILVSDGYSNSDLEGITVMNMQEYLQSGYSSDDDFVSLFHKVLDKLVGDSPAEMATNPEPAFSLKKLVADEWETTLKRLKGEADTYEQTQDLINIVKRIFNINTQPHEPQRLSPKKGSVKKSK